MQRLSDDERKALFDKVLLNELKVIREYVQEIPIIIKRLDDINDRLSDPPDNIA
jgi:hypothetical protein